MFICPQCGTVGDDGGRCRRDGTPLRPKDDPLLGELVGAYRVTDVIGEGGMGRVYLACHPSIGSQVAIKVLTRDVTRSPGLVDRFFAEAKAANVIRHHGIVNVLDLASLPDGRPYILMEHLEGQSLGQLLHEQGPLDPEAVVKIGRAILDALGAAHAHGIIHRDIKPDNVFVTTQGQVKVLDFGIAKLQPEQGGAQAPTQPGALVGTPHYMAPEQVRGTEVSPKADLYAVGLVLHECLTGQRVFEADNVYDLLHQHVATEPPLLDAIRPGLPPELVATVHRALAKDPASRHRDARAMRDALSTAPRSRRVVATTPEPGFTHAATHFDSDDSVASDDTLASDDTIAARDTVASDDVVIEPRLVSGTAATAIASTPMPQGPTRWPLALVGLVILVGGVGGGLAWSTKTEELTRVDRWTPVVVPAPAPEPIELVEIPRTPEAIASTPFDELLRRTVLWRRRQFGSAKLHTVMANWVTAGGRMTDEQVRLFIVTEIGKDECRQLSYGHFGATDLPMTQCATGAAAGLPRCTLAQIVARDADPEGPPLSSVIYRRQSNDEPAKWHIAQGGDRWIYDDDCGQ